MPDTNHTPTHVLNTKAVRWGIETLGAQRIHPTFPMYLYLRAQRRAAKLGDASASSDELLALIRMPGNPTKPYYFPFMDRGKRVAGSLLPSFWRNANIPGSWSPGSISRQKGGEWMGLAAGGYTLPDDHVDRALRTLLFGTPASAIALGAYFCRNDGFVISGEPDVRDLIAGFQFKFGYDSDVGLDFSTLFSTDLPSDIDFEWFTSPDAPINPPPDPWGANV